MPTTSIWRWSRKCWRANDSISRTWTASEPIHRWIRALPACCRRQHLVERLVQRPARRGELLRDRFAVAVIRDHALDTSDLAFDPRQAGDDAPAVLLFGFADCVLGGFRSHRIRLVSNRFRREWNRESCRFPGRAGSHGHSLSPVTPGTSCHRGSVPASPIVPGIRPTGGGNGACKCSPGIINPEQSSMQEGESSRIELSVGGDANDLNIQIQVRV